MPLPINYAGLAQTAVARCKKLATFTENPASTCRTFLSAPMRDCHREISTWLESAGASVQIDAAGNLRGYYPGATAEAPRLLIGSHLDSVPDAGAYDGILGVVIAIALLEGLSGQKLPFAIEVLGFSEEEGVRFSTPFVGSRALAGTLDDEILGRTDKSGVSVRTAIEQFGLNPAEIPHAVLKTDSLAYVEFHIEQGPVLESLHLPLGIVEAIAGQTRAEFTFVGVANHAGTTPMNLRHDALAAASEWIVEVERAPKSLPGLVATVGRIEAVPNATNIIAGNVRVSLDVRHEENNVRTGVVENVTDQARSIAQRRGLSLEHKILLDQPAVAMNPFLIEQMEHSMRTTGCPVQKMVSGAGHDAMILAEKIPAGMIFLRTPGGISHHPSETVATDDVAKAIECGMHFLTQLAAIPDLQQRIRRA